MQLQQEPSHNVLTDERAERVYAIQPSNRISDVVMQEDKDKLIRELQRRIDELTTDKILLEEQLARKERFIAMIAHELRGPLSPIITYAQMLSRHVCEPANGDEQGSQSSQSVKIEKADGSSRKNVKGAAIPRYTGIIISQAQRLVRLVNDLLDSSRLSTGQFTLSRQECDIVALVRECVEQLRPLAPHRTLAVDLPDIPVIIYADAGRLLQCLGNLLDNAIKYSDDDSVITVYLWTTSELVHVSVHNYGAVIPEDEADRLFRPYGRLPGAMERQGFGLGLYIAKCIIEAHGGVLKLESRADGAPEAKGTTFFFELPLR